jgi:hypothetical protein
VIVSAADGGFPSLLTIGAGTRIALAGAVLVGLWLAVGWAMGLLG